MTKLTVFFMLLIGLLTLPDKTSAARIGWSILSIKPTKYKVGDSIRVRTVIIYPQHTGFQKDKKGRTISARYIKKVRVRYTGKLILSMDLTSFLTQNPYIEVKVKVTQAGPLTMIWIDNHGRKFVKSIKINPTR